MSNNINTDGRGGLTFNEKMLPIVNINRMTGADNSVGLKGSKGMSGEGGVHRAPFNPSKRRIPMDNSQRRADRAALDGCQRGAP